MFLITFIRTFTNVYSTCLIIYALLSWFPGGYDTVIGEFLTRICEPYLKLFDRLNLNIGFMSFTIMVALIVLNVASSLLIRLVWMFL